MAAPIKDTSADKDSENIELQLLLEAIFLKYGYDFKNYSRAHLKRRIKHRLALCGFESISELQHKILYDSAHLETLLMDLSINVTEMFRDPTFYLAVRQELIPMLKTYPFVKIWHAGCSSGEEVYSMAIVLHEEGIYDRTQLYATDFNDQIIRRAREATYPVSLIKDYTANYQKAGGQSSFAEYYTAKYDCALLSKMLKDRIVFADHNLVTDGVFGEMHLIFCRNVLIYFNKELQNRVIGLFRDSLVPGGFLCLGSKESLQFTEHADAFEPLIESERIYRKKFLPEG